MQSFGGEINDEQIQTIIKYMHESIAEQTTYLADGIPANNTPKDIKSFARTENTSQCQYCSLKRLCDKVSLKLGETPLSV